MAKICEFIAIQFYKKNIINKDDINALRFLLELIITQFITYLSLFLMGIYIDRFIETLSYIFWFSILRKFIQGYHADTFSMCYILTMLNYIVVIGCVELIPIPFYYINIVMLIVIIFCFHEKEKKTILILTLLYGIMLILFYLIDNIYLINMYTLIYAIVLIMRFIGGNTDEYCNC